MPKCRFVSSGLYVDFRTWRVDEADSILLNLIRVKTCHIRLSNKHTVRATTLRRACLCSLSHTFAQSGSWQTAYAMLAMRLDRQWLIGILWTHFPGLRTWNPMPTKLTIGEMPPEMWHCYLLLQTIQQAVLNSVKPGVRRSIGINVDRVVPFWELLSNSWCPHDCVRPWFSFLITTCWLFSNLLMKPALTALCACY